MAIQNTNSILSDNIVKNDAYALVRTGLFYYLQVTDDEKNIFNSSSTINSRPSVFFYQSGSDTNAILDFTNASDTDKKYLEVLFSNLNDFSGITLSNATYLNERIGIENKSLDCSLLFRKYTNNILVSKVTSSVNSGDLNVLFDGNYFIDTPSIDTADSWDAKTLKNNSILICNNPKSNVNFDKFVIKPQDVIEIVNKDSQNNLKKYEVIEYKILNNKQIIKLKTTAINENLIDSPTIVNIYVKTKLKDIKNTSYGTTVTGCCKDTLITTNYYINSTEYECYIRTAGNMFFSAGSPCYNV